MQYNALKSVLAEQTLKDGTHIVAMPRYLLDKLLAGALQAKSLFDPQYYVSSNADIKEALADKRIESAEQHYFTAGYFENRLPRKILVDEEFYLTSNPDVADALRKGVVKSAQEHFENAGFKEGRAPYRDFSLF
jgi:ABC-type nitrate/sulfonate/bicarbonate transport system substrate-binding protein